METDSSLKIDLKLFASYFVPMLLSFIGSRLIAQTDIIMLSPLGADAVGAYSVPSRVMLLDAIVALALGPVVSIAMAKAKRTDEREKVIRGVLSISIYLGLALTLSGLLLYEHIVDYLISDVRVAVLAQDAVFYLTMAIPLRMAQFLGLMLIHGDGRGKVIVPLVLFTIAVNGGLNWLFIYQLGFGFSGCYFATIVSTAIELSIILSLINYPGMWRSLLRMPDKRWVFEMARKGGAEWGRLVSYQTVGLVTLAIFAIDHEGTGRLEVFTLATEMQALLLMPMIAVMRSTAIILASRPLLHSLHQIFTSMRDVVTAGLLATSVFALVLLGVDDHFWQRLYGVSAAASGWWHPFLVILAATMPLNLVNSFQRGAWQARERYTFIFAVDFCVQWLIFLPCIFIGIYLSNAWLTWAGWIFSEIATAFVYFIKRRDLVAGRDFGFAGDTAVIAQTSNAGGG
jgi:Na+-driven multidrug efflux pump